MGARHHRGDPVSAAPLKYLGLTSGLSEGGEPALMLSTPSGAVRRVPLTRSELVKIIKSAAGALELLDREEQYAKDAAKREEARR